MSKKTRAELQEIIDKNAGILYTTQRKNLELVSELNELKSDYGHLQKTSEACRIMKAHCDGMLEVYKRFAGHDTKEVNDSF